MLPVAAPRWEPERSVLVVQREERVRAPLAPRAPVCDYFLGSAQVWPVRA